MQEKQLFFVINWMDFVDKQSFIYKKQDLSPYFKELFCRILPKGMKTYDLNGAEQYVYDYCKNTENVDFKTIETNKLNKKIRWHLFGNKTDFRYLLVAELFYTLKALEADIPEDYKAFLKETLSFSDEKFIRCLDFVNKPADIPSKKIKASFAKYIEFTDGLEAYNLLPIKHIGVCACMSAGKSSFVNALLGYNFLPARNEATTARVTSIYDKDGATTLAGFAIKDSSVVGIGSNLNPQIIDSWNDNSDISHIYLQGDMDNIKNDGLVVAVHDTPGVNNSGNKLHHDITMNFLKENKMDLIIYVANAQNHGTTDEKKMLLELWKKVIKPNHIPIIFVLNKADLIDPEKENPNDMITNFKNDLSKVGYNKLFFESISIEGSAVLPISSKAAGLLKMARNGHSKRFTSKEKRAFVEAITDFNDLYNFGTNEVENISEKIIMVNDIEYPASEIERALEHSGLPDIERYIEKII